MIVHLIDGTYELFRQFYGRRHFSKGKDERFGAVSGVLHSILEMIETGATHVGVATDRVIESFRNDLWPDYKTGEGIEPALLAQFQPLEEALTAMGVVVWPMIELEADDALASAAQIASGDQRVEQRDRALLFKPLATLRTDAPLFHDVDELRWRGPTGAFAAWTERVGDARLLERCRKM